jgi:type III secretion protein J
MTPRSRSIVGLATAVSAIALAGCNQEVYSGLSQQEANAMLLALNQRGIDASKGSKENGASIVVDSARLTDAIGALNEAGFPRKKFETLGDVFKPGGLVPSPTEERARFLYATDQELTAAISQIDGVLSAQVEVVLPQNDLLARSPTPSSASVFVRYAAGSGVDQLVPQLKILVAGSVEGLQYDRVSVVLVPVALRPPQTASAPPATPQLPITTLALAALAGGMAVGGTAALAYAWRSQRRATTPAIDAKADYGGNAIGTIEGPTT